VSLGTHSNWSSLPWTSISTESRREDPLQLEFANHHSSGSPEILRTVQPPYMPTCIGFTETGSRRWLRNVADAGMIDGPQRANENLRRSLRDGESTNSHRRNRRTAFPNPGGTSLPGSHPAGLTPYSSTRCANHRWIRSWLGAPVEHYSMSGRSIFAQEPLANVADRSSGMRSGRTT
jgi:hypothetical protein